MSGLFPLNIGRKNSCWQSKTLLRVQLVFSRRSLHYCPDCICPDAATQSLCCCGAAEDEQHGYYTRYCAPEANLAIPELPVFVEEQANSPWNWNDMNYWRGWGLPHSTIWLCKARVFLILCRKGTLVPYMQLMLKEGKCTRCSAASFLSVWPRCIPWCCILLTFVIAKGASCPGDACLKVQFRAGICSLSECKNRIWFFPFTEA